MLREALSDGFIRIKRLAIDCKKRGLKKEDSLCLQKELEGAKNLS